MSRPGVIGFPPGLFRNVPFWDSDRQELSFSDLVSNFIQSSLLICKWMEELVRPGWRG
jgi:hypothetical protein